MIPLSEDELTCNVQAGVTSHFPESSAPKTIIQYKNDKTVSQETTDTTEIDSYLLNGPSWAMNHCATFPNENSKGQDDGGATLQYSMAAHYNSWHR
jgi:hypothetical protein